jgi:hypothetical protein
MRLLKALSPLLAAIVPAALMMSSCARNHAEDMAAIDSLRYEAEDFFAEKGRMEFEAWNAGTSVNADSLQKVHARLFEPQTIALLDRALRGEPDSLQRKRLSMFRQYLTRGSPAANPSWIARQVLDVSDSLYRVLLREYLPALSHREVSWSDVSELLHDRRFDRHFPSGGALQAARLTYLGLGIDIRELPALTLDTLAHPGKHAGAACFTVEVPGDVRVSLTMKGGYPEYAAVFHALGSALHAIYTRELSVEFAYMGDPSVAEAYACLSEHVLSNQAWLRIRLRLPAPELKSLIRLQAFERLTTLRLHASSAIEGGAAHGASEGTALRALLLEGELNERLERDFGVNWFENPAAGEYLRSLWAKGSRLDADELARRLGYGEIAPGPLMEHISSMILLSTR